MVIKTLPLDDEDEEDEEDSKSPTLKVNEAFAQRLAHNKQREALHRLQELQKRGVVDSSDEVEDDDENDVSSDDGFIPARTDAKIFETLAKIKKKDPSIYSEDAKFFDGEEDDDDSVHDDSDNRSKPHKPVYLKDALARQLIEDGPDLDENCPKGKESDPSVVTYADEQEAYKNEFLRSAQLDDDNDDDEGGGFLKLRRKEQPQGGDAEGELAPHDKGIAQKLEEYFGKDDNLDENDKFLKDYLLKKSWVDEDAERIPSYEEIVGDVVEDEEELERQDRFEADYNFRFEEGMGSQVLGHSRVVESSVRRKDDTRRQKREKKKERLSEVALERREELKRLKNIKKKEILDKLKKIQEVAGAKDMDGTLLQEEDLEEEFDPKEYDRKMKEAFGEEYYGAEDADEEFQGFDMEELEKPSFDEEDDLLGLRKGWDKEGCVGFTAVRKKVKELKSGDEEHDDLTGESDGDVEDGDVEDGDERLQPQSMSRRKKKGRISLREKLAFDKQLEEYYKLDYEDMIGDLPTRFKYRQVKPSMYGLNASKILAADDKDLNQYVSLKKLAPYVTEEWKPKWRFEASQKMRKKKALRQQVPMQKPGKDEKSSADAQKEVEADGLKPKKKRRKKGLSLSESRLIAYGKISLPSKKRKRT